MRAGLVLAVLYICVLLDVSSSQFSEDQYYDSAADGDARDLFNSLLGQMNCEDGQCEEAPEDLEEHMDIVPGNYEAEFDETDPSSYSAEHRGDLPHVPIDRPTSYFKLCKRFQRKMKEIEKLHPEVAVLKFKLLEKVNEFSSGLSLECKEGESLLIKILDLMVYVIEKLRIEVLRDFHRKPVPQIPEELIPIEEIVAEENEVIPGFVGSVRGIPGVHYPNYSEVPITSFSCSDRKYIPGFYADLETGCQVFHVCYEHRRESFLCPIGTIFNQPILACDYWYSSNCSLSEHYYDVNVRKEESFEISKETESNIGDLITSIIEGKKHAPVKTIVESGFVKAEVADLVQFLPVKAKVFEFTQPIQVKLQQKLVVPVPKVVKLPVAAAFIPVVKAKAVKIVAAAAIPVVKAKVTAAAAAAAVPVVKAKVVAAAVPVVKAKVVAAAAVPVAKTVKVAAAVAIAPAAVIPVIKVKKVAAVAAKAAINHSGYIPAIKAKKAKGVAAVAAKVAAGNFAAIPVVKAKVAKAIMISPLTKKALALGYLKLLKAKKIALMG